ncbi:uncharacterized protein J4E78_008576 [Alternaria triticimaculans]|uniref:uncharacterized protein n=1 Tax=Alternaria triticimaculans TaxID=297637 RepID=UPI0020C50C12|nr:uncharacterized protein J4E78_008576 [Alternaria triticimaculans]KAI4649058.1 hypothetical protein J4E78_008576 [Alternaria triticimaculans]
MSSQFGNMLNTRWSVPGQAAAPSPSTKQKTDSKQKTDAIHEKVTYPRVLGSRDADSCNNASMSYEHLLACGHLITTPTPDERCAPNCYCVEHRSHKINGDEKKKAKMLLFYCDACVEEENEKLVADTLTSAGAENLRRTLREKEATKREKQIKFRKCYIALKITSVPCHTDGALRKSYTPRKEHHPFDISIPRVGDNFFEDILVNPVKNSKAPGNTVATAPVEANQPVVGSSPASLGEAGANYLRYTAAQSAAPKVLKAKASAPNAKKTASLSAPREAAAASPVVPSSAFAQKTSPKQSRKRPIVIDDDEEYVDVPEKETEVVKRTRKRQKATSLPLSLPATPKRKPGRPKGSGRKKV